MLRNNMNVKVDSVPLYFLLLIVSITGQQIRGRTVSQLLGRPEYVCFSSDDAHVAVCTGKVINILDILTQVIYI